MSRHLVLALLEALDDPEFAGSLAAKIQPYLRTNAEPDEWMDTKHASAHLGMTPNALHKLTAARKIPFEQDSPKGKCWFRRSDLDAWRSGGDVRYLRSGRRAA